MLHSYITYESFEIFPGIPYHFPKLTLYSDSNKTLGAVHFVANAVVYFPIFDDTAKGLQLPFSPHTASAFYHTDHVLSVV